MVVKEHEPLAAHTVFKIGGPARFFVIVSSRDDLAAAVQFAQEQKLPWVLLGAGSNVLVSDAGFRGVVIHPHGGAIRIEGDRMMADAAVSMARAVTESLQGGLRGFEWAIGVPGTIGGSVVGNAGCFGSEMKDVVAAATVFNTQTGEASEWENTDLGFAYRDSVFKRRRELVILSATLRLAHGDPEEGRRLVRDYTLRRTQTQDIGSPSAGCIFKNILWSRRDVNREKLLERFPALAAFQNQLAIPAGFLIEQVGLKGRAIGQAKVSERHGNFIINTGGARADAVLMLASLAKEYVHRSYGLLLEEEIRLIGFEDFVAEGKPR